MWEKVGQAGWRIGGNTWWWNEEVKDAVAKKKKKIIKIFVRMDVKLISFYTRKLETKLRRWWQVQ